jgi:hypothetical protein
VSAGLSLVFDANYHLEESPVFKRLPEWSKSGSTRSENLGQRGCLSVPLIDVSRFSQRSRVTPVLGWEQHTSTFPGAGLSSGSGL